MNKELEKKMMIVNAKMDCFLIKKIIESKKEKLEKLSKKLLFGEDFIRDFMMIKEILSICL